jgi:hypothetical protein
MKNTNINLFRYSFENSKIELRKWYWAAFLMISSKSGISEKELQSQIGLTYKTV